LILSIPLIAGRVKTCLLDCTSDRERPSRYTVGEFSILQKEKIETVHKILNFLQSCLQRHADRFLHYIDSIDIASHHSVIVEKDSRIISKEKNNIK
jgi:hypothetical protein